MREGPEAPLFGPAGRIGLVVPANNSVIEPEFWSVLPPGTALYATRLLAKGDLTPGAVRRMEQEFERGVAEVVATGVDVVLLADMVTTFVMQADWNETRTRHVTATTGAPCASAWSALRDALAALGVTRFAPALPVRLVRPRPSWTSMRMPPPRSCAAPALSSFEGRGGGPPLSAEAHDARNTPTNRTRPIRLISAASIAEMAMPLQRFCRREGQERGAQNQRGPTEAPNVMDPSAGNSAAVTPTSTFLPFASRSTSFWMVTGVLANCLTIQNNRMMSCDRIRAQPWET